MKKILCMMIAMAVIAVNCYAAKQITLTEIKDFRFEGTINVPIQNPQTGKIEYYPAGIVFYGFPSGEGVKLRAREDLAIGTARSTPYTMKEIYDLLVQKFGQVFADKVKNIWMNGIGEDISQ